LFFQFFWFGGEISTKLVRIFGILVFGIWYWVSGIILIKANTKYPIPDTKIEFLKGRLLKKQLMYIISKIIYFFINPIIWIAILLAWSLITKHQGQRLRLLRWTVFAFLFFTLAPIFQIFAGIWEAPLTDIRTMEKKYDVGIVLGGYLDSGVKPKDRLHFTSSGTRLTTTIELYKKGIVKKILLTGGNFSFQDSIVTEADKAAQFLQILGIPDSNIIIESNSLDTRENAVFSKKMIQQQGAEASVLLITSAWHMRRAEACFQKVGFKTLDTFSTDPFSGRIITSWNYYLFPNTTILEAWRILIKEWVGFAIYKLVGYL
jgi:uncharacterized SAM-binding protein YcdF (DUF218 family)